MESNRPIGRKPPVGLGSCTSMGVSLPFGQGARAPLVVNEPGNAHEAIVRQVGEVSWPELVGAHACPPIEFPGSGSKLVNV